MLTPYKDRIRRAWRALRGTPEPAAYTSPIRPRPVDPDSTAVQLLALALIPLDQAARARVLKYAWGRFVDEPSNLDQVRKTMN